MVPITLPKKSKTTGDEVCRESSGCQGLKRPAPYDGNENGVEHIAGPGCVSGRGYSGHRISLEEMKGCRAVQCLMIKNKDWLPEADDQDFELESKYLSSARAR